MRHVWEVLGKASKLQMYKAQISFFRPVKYEIIIFFFFFFEEQTLCVLVIGKKAFAILLMKHVLYLEYTSMSHFIRNFCITITQKMISSLFSNDECFSIGISPITSITSFNAERQRYFAICRYECCAYFLNCWTLYGWKEKTVPIFENGICAKSMKCDGTLIRVIFL